MNRDGYAYMKRIVGLVSAFLLVMPLASMADGPATRCAGSSPCLCPDGSRPMAGCNDDCRVLCGLDSGGSSSGGSSNSLAGQILLQGAALLGKAIGESLRGNPQEDAARQAEAARAAEQKRQAEAARAAEQEETRQRLMGSLKGVESSSQLGLMGVDAAPDLQLMTGDQAASVSTAPDAAKTKPDQPTSRSTAFTRGHDDASQCFSQNSGPHCAGLAGTVWQTCLDDYRAGYAKGDKERARLMQQARQAGQLAAAKGELANGASDPLADGPCRIDWIKTYNEGYFQGKHAKAK